MAGSVIKPDFSGWATKSDIRCTDGRVIMPGAFKHQDKMKVPLVWNHRHGETANVLGYAILEHRDAGVYAYGYFNGNESAKEARELLAHGDIETLSIYANNLIEHSMRDGKQVQRGDIKELSLVLAGANPGALIDNITIRHGDDVSELDEAVIYTGLPIEHSDMVAEQEKDDDMADEKEAVEKVENDDLEHADDAEETTVKEIYEAMTEEQKTAVLFMIGQAVEAGKEIDDEDQDDEEAKHSEIVDGEDFLAIIKHSIKEGMAEMTTHNVFDESGDRTMEKSSVLSHSEFAEIMTTAQKSGSLRETFLAHAATHGIDNIEHLFPEAKALSGKPEVHGRRTEWVAKVLGETKHAPFGKVKSTVFDITGEEARARGYIKGNQKADEVVELMKRTTGPTTIYKKQKLDRDDIVDITDMDVVAWLMGEMRLMIEEEIARAILFGDGRPSSSPDKIKDPSGSIDGNGIRSIVNDDDFYSVKADLAANVSPKDAVKGIIRARAKYRGTGKPTLFISDIFLTDIMLEEDKFGRPLYETEKSLADKLRVSEIVTVDVIDDMESLFAVMVNLADYTVGTNKGGELTTFNDFDIDFNQYKYLIETRLSGALTKPLSAVVIRRLQGTSVAPTPPSFEGETGFVTLTQATGVEWYQDGDLVTDNEVTVVGKTSTFTAAPATGYYFPNGTVREWTFTGPAGG